MQQIDAHQFWIKMAGILAVTYIFLIYLFIRYLISGYRFLASAQLDEEKMIKEGKFTLKDLQNGAWQFNFQKSVSYSAFSLATLILAAIFIFEQKLTGYDALMFTLVLVAFGTSVISYFASLQFWFLALDAGGSIYTRVKYRHLATGFQAVGWVAIGIAVFLALMAVNTVLGYIFSIIGLFELIIVMEYKFKISIQDEYQQAALNEFQLGVEYTKIYLKNAAEPPAPYGGREVIRILNWNIERGFKPDALLAYIKETDADIVCLQEVDWGNLRTNQVDVLDYLAQRTGMMGLYGIEFYEIQTPYRNKRTAGGGVHGNAILTRIRPSSYYRLEMPTDFNWNKPTRSQALFAKYEKRQGARFAICAEFGLSDRKLMVSSVHLEDKVIGMPGRFAQFQSIADQLNARISPGDVSVIAGDLNTLSNWQTGMIGMSKSAKSMDKPWYVSECCWWKQHLLPQFGYVDPWGCRDWTHNVLEIYREKLDWVLVKNSQIVNYGKGGPNTSDHCPLWVDISLTASPEKAV